MAANDVVAACVADLVAGRIGPVKMMAVVAERLGHIPDAVFAMLRDWYW